MRALRKAMDISGKSKIATEFGDFITGESQITINAYIKVDRVTSTKDVASALVSFSENEIVGQKEYTFAPDMNGENFIKQAYEHIKTLPEFAGAADV